MPPDTGSLNPGTVPHAPAQARRMRGHGWAWRGLAIGAAILAIIAISSYWATRREAAPRYVTAAIDRGSVARAVTATGTVNPVLTIIVGSYVSGVIQDLSCDFNTRVTKGQLCAKIDPRPYQTIVDQNAAALVTARAQLAKDQASLVYAKLSYQRDLGILNRGVVSQDTVDLAKSAYDQAAAQVEFDNASIVQHQAELNAAQVNLDYTNIVSPVDGTVVSRNVTIGQTVAASFQTPTLFLIATDLTKMEVDTNVSESDIGGVQEGNASTFTVEAFQSRVFTGKVVQVRQAPQTVQNVVTYDVVVGVENTDLALKPGMTATTRIVTDRRDQVLRVPDQALRFSPTGLASPGGAAAGKSIVWILRDGRAAAVPVVLGLDDDTNSEVTGGELKPGDRAIIGEERGAGTQGSRQHLFGIF